MDDSSKDLYRGAICKTEILAGRDVLGIAQEYAKNLYNFTWYCAVGFNRKLARARGHTSLAGRLPKYPGAFGMSHMLCDTEEYKVLNSRLAGYVVRGFDQSMRSWFSNVKCNPDARPPRYSKMSPPLVFEVGSNAKFLGNNQWKLTALCGKNSSRHIVVRLYLPPLTNPERLESIKYLSDGRVAISYKVRQRVAVGCGVASIDLGIRHAACLAFESGESILYHGGALLSEQRYWQSRIKECKPSGWKGQGDGRRLPQSARAQIYYRKWNGRKLVILRALADSIVEQSKARFVRTLIVGDLKGVRDNADYGPQTNQLLHAWPFALLTDLITTKAERDGIRVVKISERNTSKTCCKCGYINKSSARHVRGELKCAQCETRIHSDVNGAFNILKKYLHEQEYALGVTGALSALPSPAVPAQRTGELRRSQIAPTFIAKADLQHFAIKITRIAAQSSAVATHTSDLDGV